MVISNQNVKEKSRELTARVVGVASVDRWKEAPEGVQPETVLPGAKSVIVFGVPIPRGMVETIPGHLWSREHGHLMGGKVDEISTELAYWLEEEGFKSCPIGGLSIPKVTYYTFSKALGGVPYNDFEFYKPGGIALNMAGVAAGIGTLGKSGNLLVPKYGPNIILGGVVTTAEIEPDPIMDYELCTDCDDCIEKCPGDAISVDGEAGKPIFDPIKCWLMNAVEGRTFAKASEAGDKAVIENLQKTVFMLSEATPATCICGEGCLASCPIDNRIKKLK